MNQHQDIEDFPAGTRVRTPTGKEGIVLKSRGHESRHDNFQRVVVKIGPRPRDTVVLQPGLLQFVEEDPHAGERSIEP